MSSSSTDREEDGYLRPVSTLQIATELCQAGFRIDFGEAGNSASSVDAEVCFRFAPVGTQESISSVMWNEEKVAPSARVRPHVPASE